MTNELLKLVANSPAGVTAVGSGDWLGITSNGIILWISLSALGLAAAALYAANTKGKP
jgi:hypothetical protein